MLAIVHPGTGLPGLGLHRRGPVRICTVTTKNVLIRRSAILARATKDPENGQGSSRSKNVLDSLESMLGSSDDGDSRDTPASSSRDPRTGADGGKLVEWWAVKPRQAAPPRQRAMAPGVHGRFVMNEDFLKMNELRVGRKTEVGSQLELPKVQPIVSFVLLLVTLACYATYLNISLLQGPEAAAEFMAGLSASSDELHWGGVGGGAAPLTDWLLRPLASVFMSPGPLELGAAVWGFAMVAPRAESVMGYGTFTAVFLLSGLTGAAVQLAEAGATATSAPSTAHCGAVAALLGVAASLATHHLRNKSLEAQASNLTSAGWDASTAAQRDASAGFDEIFGLSSNPSSSPPASPATATSSAPVATRTQTTTQPPPAAVGAKPQLSQQVQWMHTVGVVGALLALAGLSSLEGNGQVAVACPGLAASTTAMGAGVLLTLGMGPQFSVTQELDIPEGSMTIPDNAREMVVVIDRTTSFQRLLTAGTYLAFLCVLLAGVASS